MDINRKYEHIEDVLVHLHPEQWFGWSDTQNKIYANLILHEKIEVNREFIDNPHSLPTEKFLTDALVKQQSDFDAQEYARNRQAEYPDWGTQLNKIYDDGIAKWKTEMVDPIKAKYQKP